MSDTLVPIAVSSQLDESGEERIHAASMASPSEQRPLLPVTVTGNIPDGELTGTIEGQYTGHGGVPPYIFSIQSGQLPPNITMQEDGAFSGTFQTEGEYSWVVEAQDSVGTVGSLEDNSVVTGPE